MVSAAVQACVLCLWLTGRNPFEPQRTILAKQQQTTNNNDQCSMLCSLLPKVNKVERGTWDVAARRIERGERNIDPTATELKDKGREDRKGYNVPCSA